MKVTIRTALFLLLASTSPLLAQPRVEGKWAGVIAGPQVDQNVTLILAVAGDTVTGTISNFQGGEQAIEDGMIQGDTLSFYQTLDFDGNRFEIFYSALVAAEELLFSLEVPGMPQSLRFTAKRAP